MTNIFLFLLILFGLMLIATLKKKSKMLDHINKIDEIEKQIDKTLEKRFNVFSALIEVMGKYMDIEKSTFREVAELEKKAVSARSEGDEKSRVGDEDKISRDVEGISYAFEQHEGLKKDKIANELYNSLIEQEGELAKLKQHCNEQIALYHSHRYTVIGSLAGVIFRGQLNNNYEKWRVNADALDEGDKYQVEM